MRLIPEETSTLMMNTVSDLLSDESVSPFEFSPINARILSGEEEGVFAWIDVNYKLGVFSDGRSLTLQSQIKKFQRLIWIETEYASLFCSIWPTRTNSTFFSF